MVNILVCEKSFQTLLLQSFCYGMPERNRTPARGLEIWHSVNIITISRLNAYNDKVVISFKIS